MGKPGVKPLSTERKPIPPAPKPSTNTQGVSHHHRVIDGEDWHSLAKLYEISAKQLMLFNFKTTDPDKVNWYLREYVGCDVPDEPRHNWKLSKSADPGIIYIPARIYNMYDLNDPDSRPDYARRNRSSTEPHNVFNIALASGYATGRTLNLPQRRSLFQLLHPRMAQEDLPSSKQQWDNWSDAKKSNYYNGLALAFKLQFLQ
jgi:hypothetical protein